MEHGTPKCPCCEARNIVPNITTTSLRSCYGRSIGYCSECNTKLCFEYGATDSTQSYLLDLDESVVILECGVIELFFPTRFELRVKAYDTELDEYYSTVKEYEITEITELE